MKKILFFFMFWLSLVVQAEPCYREGMTLDQLTPCAEQGDVAAQRDLGTMYFQGQTVTKDYNKAFQWYSKAAEQGDANAQNALGLMYKEASGVTIDDDQAFVWFLKAAEQGYAIAQNNVGLAYAKGDGTPKDYVSSYMWFNLSASQNNADGIKLRDQLIKKLTPEELTKAQQMTNDWLAKHKSN